MSALTSLLARDQVVPVRKIEEALQRQVVSGGAIETVLLEMGVVAENVLAAYAAAASGLPAATRDEVMGASRDVVRLVPREVAEQHRIVPFAVEGRTLRLAVTAPLAQDVAQHLAFLLGHELAPHLVLEVRLLAALAQHYGFEPLPRLARLADKLRERDAGDAPYVAPLVTRNLEQYSGAERRRVGFAAFDDDDDDDGGASSLPPPLVRSSWSATSARPATPRPSAPGADAGATGERSTWPGGPSSFPPREGRATIPGPASHVPARVDDDHGRPTVTGPDDDAPPSFRARASRADERPTSPGDAWAGHLPRHTLPGMPRVELPAPHATPAQAHAEPTAAPVIDDAPGRAALAPPAPPAPTASVNAPAEPMPSLSAPPPPPPPGWLAAVVTPPTGANRLPTPTPDVAAWRGGVGGEPWRASSSRPPAGAGVRALLSALRASGAPPPPASTAPASPSAAPSSPSMAPAAERPSSPGGAASSFAVRLRGPLMPRTVAELLAEASNRDEILAAFFAFARQFFDYSALFVVQDDLAEGREAHGPGATTAEVERISLALEEPGLYAETRRLGIARVTSLDANDADRALAARLRRPEGAPCVVLPLSIRRRVVLILHGDRSGDAVTLEDLPELLGVVPRVGEAFERLILRRKVGRAGETQMPEAATPAATSIPRAAAIPRDAARALAAIASAGVSVAPGPITAEKVAALDVEAPPQPPIAATSPASPPAVQAAAQGAAASVVPARSVPGAADALAMLGVPRSAPPPPMPGRTQRPAQVEHDDVIVEVSAAPPDDDDAEDQDADDRDVTVEVSATSRDDDEDDDRDVTVDVSATSRDDDDEDDDRDVTVEVSATPLDDDDADSDDEDEHPTSPGRVTAPTAVAVPPSDPAHARRGGYSLKDVADEVVAVRPPAATKPTSDRASPRQDPRRDGSSTTRDEQIRVGNAARPASKPSLTRDTRPDSPNSHARRRSAPPATASRHREPSVIVDMGDQVEALLDELTSMSPDGPPTFFDRLLRIGDAALPALAQRFPGGLWFDRHAPHTRPPRGRDVSAIARALTIFHERAVPYLPGLLDASEQDIRYYATLVAADLPHPTLVEALGRRLFDTDAGTRVLALDVIKGFAHFPEFATLREELRTTARVLHRDLTRRRTAIRALAELRDAQAVPMLLAVLDDDDEGVRGEAHRALVTLTRQDFGLQRKRWEPWAEKHARAHRIEWLIDALLHDDESLRAAAGDELKRVTQEYYGYHPGSPRRERERVHRKYQQWWESEGRARF